MRTTNTAVETYSRLGVLACGARPHFQAAQNTILTKKKKTSEKSQKKTQQQTKQHAEGHTHTHKTEHQKKAERAIFI